MPFAHLRYDVYDVFIEKLDINIHSNTIITSYEVAVGLPGRTTAIGNFIVEKLDTRWSERTEIDALAFAYGFIKNINATGMFVTYCDGLMMEGQDHHLELCEQVGTSGDFSCDNVESTAAICALLENPTLNDTDPDLHDALLKASGLESIVSDFRNTVSDALSTYGQSLIPEERWMVTIPLTISIIVAFFTAIRCSLFYIPSITTTVFQLRAGVIPALGNPDFDKCRKKPDTIALLTGASFWGCFVSALLSGAIVGFIIFLFLWQQTSYQAFQFIIIGAGFAFFMLIRFMVSTCMQ